MRKLVVLTGAGISAESGLKTFRDSDGLWEGHDIRDVATPGAWKKDPALVLEFYNMRRQNVLAAKPNAAHYGLAELEESFDVQIITQNVDDLHERAGSTKVMHLHGEILKMRSERNEMISTPIYHDIKIGDLAPDGAQYRPAIVWFEELVPMMEHAVPLVAEAEIFAVIGTSLVVYPAAGLINYTRRGIPKFIIDKTIPYSADQRGIVAIEKPATEGILEFRRLLAALS
ncbi:SIR2 family NAD-dependent protein deacylase [Flavitalea antarctica]